MTLGKRLKELRTQSGFSQEMVAERIGVSRQAVTKWESGRTIPTAENLAALAQLYQVPLTQLNEDRSAWVRDGEDNPMLRENKTVIALSAQLGSLYACSGTLRGLFQRIFGTSLRYLWDFYGSYSCLHGDLSDVSLLPPGAQGKAAAPEFYADGKSGSQCRLIERRPLFLRSGVTF